MKVLRNTVRKDRTNPKEPKLPPSLPAPPMNLDDIARRAWDQVGKTLVNMRVLTDADQMGLQLICEAYADYIQTRECLRDPTGEFVGFYEAENEDGEKKLFSHPMLGATTRIRRELMAYLAEYGLTPASRSKVSFLTDSEEDPFENFLKKNKSR